MTCPVSRKPWRAANRPASASSARSQPSSRVRLPSVEPRAEVIQAPRPDPLSPPARVDPDLSREDAGVLRPPRRVEAANSHHAGRIQRDPLLALTISGGAGVLRLVPLARSEAGCPLPVGRRSRRSALRHPSISAPKSECFRSAGRASLRVPSRSILFMPSPPISIQIEDPVRGERRRRVKPPTEEKQSGKRSRRS